LKPGRADQPRSDISGTRERPDAGVPLRPPIVEMAGVHTPLKFQNWGIFNNPTAGSYAGKQKFLPALVHPSPTNCAAAGSVKGHTNQQRCHLWLIQINGGVLTASQEKENFFQFCEFCRCENSLCNGLTDGKRMACLVLPECMKSGKETSVNLTVCGEKFWSEIMIRGSRCCYR
jgi:hypothetical protein